MERLGKYRCFAAMFVFLVADVINISWEAAGKASWLFYFAGAALATPFYNWCARLCCRRRTGGGTIPRLLAMAMCLLSLAGVAAILGQFALFVTTSNDFEMSPAFVAGLLAVTSLYMALLGGHGFERYIDAAVVWISVFLILFFAVSGGDWQVGRLLPINDGAAYSWPLCLVRAFVRPFAQGFVCIAVLSGRAKEEDIIPGCRAGLWAAALALAFERIENICSVGYRISSKYNFPTYAVASVQRFTSYGLHVEEVLMCALITARMIKIGILLRFCRMCFAYASGCRYEDTKAVLCGMTLAAYAAGMVFLSTASGAEGWLSWSPWPVGLLFAVVPAAGYFAGKAKNI